jgi:hypothetical protein
MPFPATHNFTYYRGDTYEFDIVLKNQDGTDFNLALYEKIIFKIANKRGSTGTQATAVAEMILPSTVRCKITPSVGRTLSAGDYVFDVQIQDDGSSYTPISNITFWAQWAAVNNTSEGGTPDVLPDTAPAISTATISGTAKVGQVLTAGATGVTGSPTPVLGYQWKSGGTNVGTNSNTYTIVSGDLTKTITVVITATNGVGTAATATSAATSAVAAADAIPAGQYRVTWNANGGTGGTTTTKAAGESHFAPAVARTGFTLSNWRNPESGGTPIFLNGSPDTVYTVLTGTITVVDDISGAV